MKKIRDGKFTIKVEFDKDSKPGLYQLKTTLTVNDQTFVSESEFAWGLVSLNTVKSIYNPGETADFVIVVLDNGGHPVCDANISMSITASDSKITMLSSGNGITANAECGLYDAQYTTTVEGTYLVDINTQTQGINTNFSTTFDVSSFFEFDIIRTAQSKIDPITNPNSFDVRIDVESFVGGQSVVIKESIPVVFDVVTDGTVQIVGDTKILTWNKSLVGDKTFVEYSYSIPLVFPQLYALDPIEINYEQSQFTEARPWFVAADPASSNTLTQIIKVSGIYTATTGTQDFTISPALSDLNKAFSFCTFNHAQTQQHAKTFKAWEIFDINTLRLFATPTTPANVNFVCYVIEFDAASSLDTHETTFQLAANAAQGEKINTIGQTITLAETMEWYQGHAHLTGETTIGQEELDRIRLTSTTQWGWQVETTPNSGP